MQTITISDDDVVINREVLTAIVARMIRLQMTRPENTEGGKETERLVNIACLTIDPDDNEARDYLVKIGEIKE